MHAIDFSPLHRFAVGFDRIQQQLDSALRVDPSSLSYPPYNIEAREPDSYRITMAVAGFGPDDLEVTVKENTLFVSGKAKKDREDVTYLHRGIAGRSFERRFELAEHIRVTGAELVNGLLNIDLAREVPEEKKPRKIAIETGERPKASEKKAAA